MKMTKIALVLAALLASAQASAGVTPAQITAARAAGTLQQAWISGASASARSIYEGWVGAGTGVGCDPGSNTIFTNQAGTNTSTVPGTLGNFVAYACTRGGVTSVLYHTFDGGSLNAFTPHTIGTKLARVKFVGAVPTAGAQATAITAANGGVAFTGNGCTTTLLNGYVDATNADNNADLYKGCSLIGSALPANGVATPAGNTANATAVNADALAPNLPVGGFSDVEPAILPAALGGGAAAVNAKGVAAPANFGQAFGVVVSRNLYRALQVAQGIAANTDALDPNFDPANAPNITSEQYVAIADQAGGYHTDWAPLLGATGAGKKVVLARRVNSSGTQASSNAFFLRNPCSSALGGALTPAAASDSTATFEVFEGNGTGNVKQRLSLANLQGDFAIGVISMENDWRIEAVPATPTVAAPGSHQYRFVKLNSVHPETGDTANARVTATTGAYDFHMESYSFERSTPAKTAFETGIIAAIDTALINPPSAAACNVFPRGLTLNPIAGSICTVGAQVANGTNFGNSCSPIGLTQ